jgi:hypothetical protein
MLRKAEDLAGFPTPAQDPFSSAIVPYNQPMKRIKVGVFFIMPDIQ